MRRYFWAVVACWHLAGNLFSAPPGGYYDAAAGRTGIDLEVALHEIIKGHCVVGYASLWKAYRTTDVRANGKPWCIYSDYRFVSFKENPGGIPGKVGSYLTREHSWPKNWWGGRKNAAYSDLFHVLPGDAHVNGKKGVKPLGEADENAESVAISKVGRAKPGLGYEGEVFEPADQYKGDFARNYLYFAVRYLVGAEALDCKLSPMIEADGRTFKPWAIRLLLKWNKQDSVSERERTRNDEVFKLQGNRNPFIDHPEYANAIWAVRKARRN